MSRNPIMSGSIEKIKDIRYFYENLYRNPILGNTRYRLTVNEGIDAAITALQAEWSPVIINTPRQTGKTSFLIGEVIRLKVLEIRDKGPKPVIITKDSTMTRYYLEKAIGVNELWERMSVYDFEIVEYKDIPRKSDSIAEIADTAGVRLLVDEYEFFDRSALQFLFYREGLPMPNLTPDIHLMVSTINRFLERTNDNITTYLDTIVTRYNSDIGMNTVEITVPLMIRMSGCEMETMKGMEEQIKKSMGNEELMKGEFYMVR